MAARIEAVAVEEGGISMAARIEAVAVDEAALSVRGLTVDLPKGMERAYAVENISFDLKRGQILCIIGESGSGKSVTANTIMGLLPKMIPVSSGAIRSQRHGHNRRIGKKTAGFARPGRVHDIPGSAFGA